MIASAAGPMFQKAIDATEVLSKDAEYLAGVFTEVIEDIGESKVVQVITDNASNYKAAGAIIERKFPNIFWTPCVVHCLNLVLKSICEPNERASHYIECQWISQLVHQVNEINYFILNHGLSTTIFERYADVKLLKVAETRFGSKIVMATRIQRLKDALEKTVMDPDWKKFKVNGRNPIELKAREVKDLLVSDAWWDQVDYLLKFTEPMMNFLRAADMDSSVLHLVYDMWDTMIEEVKKIIFEHEGVDLVSGQSSFFDAIQHVIESRWNKSNTLLHCMAHSLVPRYYTEEWLQGGGNSIRRVAPNEDEEVSTNRNKCLQRLFPNSDDARRVFLEYGTFSGSLENFSEPHVTTARAYEDPLSWWANYDSTTPLLQSLAFKLLS
ncbi:uncharacterized protein LOC109832704 isoform X1 [Asparagus officinalis]|uniref:uncharacterized protein LOC109832704 isoform X1 n=1 Tax=Asparagus officinalis TaxID=4686 RepID=UPI00098E47F2|nr:uncharacterized protein LOC109832704 isoform X1 [Asparagus officinalis]XP_020255695.1 uncharacterized protein LOC109832704 isoform X1 [Asparagus officinalis]